MSTKTRAKTTEKIGYIEYQEAELTHLGWVVYCPECGEKVLGGNGPNGLHHAQSKLAGHFGRWHQKEG